MIFHSKFWRKHRFEVVVGLWNVWKAGEMSCETVGSKGGVVSVAVVTSMRIHSDDDSRVYSWFESLHGFGGARGLIFRRCYFCCF